MNSYYLMNIIKKTYNSIHPYMIIYVLIFFLNKNVSKISYILIADTVKIELNIKIFIDNDQKSRYFKYCI